MVAVKVIQRPCGAGKTKEAVRRMAEVAGQGGTVLYVAPTVALALQVRDWLISEGVDSQRIVLSFGRRLFPRTCDDPNALLCPHLGEAPDTYCNTYCAFFPRCAYFSGKTYLHLAPPGVIVLTTLTYLVYNTPGSVRDLGVWNYDVVVYDDINRLLFVGKRPFSRYARPGLRCWVKMGGMDYGIIALYPGRETIFLSATPPMDLLPLAFNMDREKFQVEVSYALRQQVTVSLLHLPMGRRFPKWSAPMQTCGFKKNTAEGLPYFQSSEGLGNWRGVPLKVVGSFQPPLQVYAIWAALLEKLTGHPHSVSLIPVILHFDNHKPIQSAMFGVRNARYYLCLLPPVHALAQLLGRAGIDVDTVYVGDIPLNFSVIHPDGAREVFQTAEKVVLEKTSDDVLEYLRRKHLVASALEGFIHQSFLQTEDAETRRYYGLMKKLITQANAQKAQLLGG